MGHAGDGKSYRNLIEQLDRNAKRMRHHQRESQGAFAMITFAELLRTIIPPGSSNFRWSSIRYGTCKDLQSRLETVFEEYVGQFERTPIRRRIDDQSLWQTVISDPSVEQLKNRIETGVTIANELYQYSFQAGWVNGHRQVAEAISFDYIDPQEMIEKANKWRGRLEVLSQENDFSLTATITDPPAGLSKVPYEKARKILSEDKRVREVFTQSEVDKFAHQIAADLN